MNDQNHQVVIDSTPTKLSLSSDVVVESDLNAAVDSINSNIYAMKSDFEVQVKSLDSCISEVKDMVIDLYNRSIQCQDLGIYRISLNDGFDINPTIKCSWIRRIILKWLFKIK